MARTLHALMSWQQLCTSTLSLTACINALFDEQMIGLTGLGSDPSLGDIMMDNRSSVGLYL